MTTRQTITNLATIGDMIRPTPVASPAFLPT